MFKHDFIINCLAKAAQHQSKLPKEAVDVVGFAPAKMRHFLNNLCSDGNVNYLEVGAFKGATAIAASYGNSGKFTTIDNFSEFKHVEGDLRENLRRFQNKCSVDFVEGDSFSMDKSKLPHDVNVYFYDGNHSLESQEWGITQFDQVLAKEFVLLVDDYSWSDSNRGTARALEKLNYKVHTKIEIMDLDNKQGWWNGLLVLHASKR